MTKTQIPKKPEEFKHWVEYRLKVNRSSFAKVARTCGLTRQAVQAAMAVNKPSAQIAEAIAAEIGIPKWVLWPDRFSA